MKILIRNYMLLMSFILPLIVGCDDEDETYAKIPNELYIVNVPVNNPVNFTNNLSGAPARENITGGAARVYLNQIVQEDVTVSFTFSGTATPGVDYIPPASNTITIPAGKRFGQINFTVIDDVEKDANETVIITLQTATGNFQVGLGYAKSYTVFTYTIQDND